jgi:hypothetical protein
MKTRIIQDEATPEPAEDRPDAPPAKAEPGQSPGLLRLFAALRARLGRRSSHLSNGGT